MGLPADRDCARHAAADVHVVPAGVAGRTAGQPDHGSKTSSTAAFIGAVRPEMVLFPVGYRNRFHHPHPAVVARYDEVHARHLDSASAGAIELWLRADGMSVSAWRARHRRYWHLRGDD